MKTGAKVLLLVMSLMAVLGLASSNTSAAGAITINEFAAQPPTGEADWVELHNSSGAAVSLDGWYLRDTATSNMKTFTSSDEVPAGGFLVVAVGTRLGNAGDTIELYSPAGLEDGVSYPAQVAVPAQAQSAGRTTDGVGGYVVFETPTKGASNNPLSPTYGEIRVHAVKEINDNLLPDFASGEPHQAGIPVRVYAVTPSGWQLVAGGATTGKAYGKSLRFTLLTGQYAVCLPVQPGYAQTFARQITGWLSFPDAATVNQSSATDEYAQCLSVAVQKDAITSHVFGLRDNQQTL